MIAIKLALPIPRRVAIGTSTGSFDQVSTAFQLDGVGLTGMSQHG